MAICICTTGHRSAFCAAHMGHKAAKVKHATPKQRILLADPEATLDYREFLRANGQPCYFIRHGLQGDLLHSELFATPRAAWAAAEREFMASFRKAAA